MQIVVSYTGFQPDSIEVTGDTAIANSTGVKRPVEGDYD